MVKIVYEDNQLLVIDKPPGLVVSPSETQKEKTLSDILTDEYDIKLLRGGVVHRLDKDTSGLLLVAKTQEAFENLQKQFKERVVKKEYIALVHGSVESAGRVEGAIERNPENREKFTVLPGGKEAVTEYTPLERLQVSDDRLQEIFSGFNKIQMRKLGKMKYNQFTLLSCKPLTGRTHQIRVHLKYIRYPIVADEKYVGRKMYRLDHRWCPRQFLHAEKISFRHPVSDKWVQFISPLPNDLENVLKRLKNQE